MTPPTQSQASRTVLVTACSGLFFDQYLDLLDSLIQVGLRDQFDIGLIDLGMLPGQLAQLEAHQVKVVPARWPIEPPPTQQAIHLIAFAGKPFARDFFPGYDDYVWMDADMWVQTRTFWDALMAGAQSHGGAVPVEVDVAYGSMAMAHWIWMVRHLSRSYGISKAIQVARQPVVNNGLFALRADAPQWELWQQHFRAMVSKTQRTLAIDQLAMMAMQQIESPKLALIDAGNNWVCSLGTPDFDEASGQFVKPGRAHEAISVMHITTPSRARKYSVQHSDGKRSSQYLHRPGGRFVAQLA
ncbi:MAG: hypothetical protein ACRBC3_21860 [Burkholderiaceae bacterium]